MQAVLLEKIKTCESASEFLALLHVVAKTATQHDNAFFTLFIESCALKLKTLFFDQGELPPREILQLSLVCKEALHVKLESSLERYFETLAQAFFGEYERLDDAQSEKYVYHALLCVCELLSLGYREGMKRYIKRTLLFDTRGANLQNEWVRAFEYHLSMDTFEMAVVMEAISELIEPSFFFALPKAHQRSIFFWWLHVIWTHKAYMNHPSWGDFSEPLALLCKEVLAKNELATQMYIHFFSYQILGNLAQTKEAWRGFNEAFNLPQSNYLRSLHVKALEHFTNPKKKIVFVKDRIVENSPFKVEYSLLSALMSDEAFTQNYEPYVLSMGYIDKAPDQEVAVKKLEALGVKVLSPAQSVHDGEPYYDHLTKAMLIREWFLEHHIDIMVGCVNGYDIMNFLFVMRCASLQIYWSHGDFEYDVEGIDKRISHFLRQNPFAYEKMSVQPLEEFHNPNEILNIEKAYQLRQQWEDETIILGTIGRLVKLDNDLFISALAKILKHYPNTIYLACGTGHEESIQKRLVHFKIPKERFVFVGFVDAHVYGHLIDLYVNTFPEPSGEALGEFMEKKGTYNVVFKETPSSFESDILTLENIQEKMNSVPLFRKTYFLKEGFMGDENTPVIAYIYDEKNTFFIEQYIQCFSSVTNVVFVPLAKKYNKEMLDCSMLFALIRSKKIRALLLFNDDYHRFVEYPLLKEVAIFSIREEVFRNVSSFEHFLSSYEVRFQENAKSVYQSLVHTMKLCSETKLELVENYFTQYSLGAMSARDFLYSYHMLMIDTIKATNMSENNELSALEFLVSLHGYYMKHSDAYEHLIERQIQNYTLGINHDFLKVVQ